MHPNPHPLIGAAIAAALVLSSCQDRPSEQRKRDDARAAELHTAQQKQLAVDGCKRHEASLRSKYTEQMAARDFQAAELTLAHCALTLDSQELRTLMHRAWLGRMWATATDRRAQGWERASAARALKAHAPASEPVLSRIEAEAMRQIKTETTKAEAKERARKRQSGVHIGMTADEVLASSWGKPERINQTTTALGTREQWVYGNGNYLYLEGSVLKSIQTSRDR